MAFFTDAVFDSGLLYVVASVDQINICSQQPTTYTEATSTYSLGSAATTLTPPQDGSPSGRAVIVPTINSAEITASGTVAFWVIVDTATSTLVASGPLEIPQPVLAGNAFATDAITITIVDPIAI